MIAILQLVFLCSCSLPQLFLSSWEPTGTEQVCRNTLMMDGDFSVSTKVNEIVMIVRNLCYFFLLYSNTCLYWEWLALQFTIQNVIFIRVTHWCGIHVPMPPWILCKSNLKSITDRNTVAKITYEWIDLVNCIMWMLWKILITEIIHYTYIIGLKYSCHIRYILHTNLPQLLWHWHWA